MVSGLEIMDRSLSSRFFDAVLFFFPTCLLFYLVAFQFKHQAGNLSSVVFHWCLILAISALAAVVLYNLLHSVCYQIAAGSVLRTEHRFVLIKSVETIPGEAVGEVMVETAKNSFTGSPRYLLVLRLKTNRAETITTLQSEQRARELQASITALLHLQRR